jgi:hypothetical protein
LVETLNVEPLRHEYGLVRLKVRHLTADQEARDLTRVDGLRLMVLPVRRATVPGSYMGIALSHDRIREIGVVDC